MEQNRNRTIFGSYSSVDEARRALEDLKRDGYRKEDITLYANEPHVSHMDATPGVDTPTDQELQASKDSQSDESFWEEVKDMFTPNRTDSKSLEDSEYAEDRELLEPYQEDLSNGHILLALRGDRADGTQI